MARKKQAKKLTMLDYTDDSSCMSCSGCTGKVPKGSVFIGGNLVGSGVKPFLILCPSCQVVLHDLFKDRDTKMVRDVFESVLSTKNRNAVDVARQQRGVL